MVDGILCSVCVCVCVLCVNFGEKDKIYFTCSYKMRDTRYVSTAPPAKKTFTGSQGLLSELLQLNYNVQMKNISLKLYKMFSSLKA